MCLGKVRQATNHLPKGPIREESTADRNRNGGSRSAAGHECRCDGDEADEEPAARDEDPQKCETTIERERAINVSFELTIFALMPSCRVLLRQSGPMADHFLHDFMRHLQACLRPRRALRKV